MVPELIVPAAMTEILLVDGTLVAALEAKIPEAAELMTAPEAIDTAMLPPPSSKA